MKQVHIYWEGEESALADVREAWGEKGWTVQVWGTDAVADFVNSAVGPDQAALFRRIRIPSCKADVARVVLLYQFGGIYIDAHVGPPSQNSFLDALVAASNGYELVIPIIVDKDGADVLLPGVMLASAAAPVLLDLLSIQFESLETHLQRETDSDVYVPYNIYALVGAWRFRQVLLEHPQNLDPGGLRTKYRQRVLLAPTPVRGEERPFVLYQFYSYREPGLHWSERQQRERLFQP